MRFGSSRSQLYDAQKTARGKWAATEEYWNDSARRDFEDHIGVPLDQLVTDVLRAVDQLTVLFTQIRTECEYNPD